MSTDKRDAELRKITDKFRKDVEKLGLGVTVYQQGRATVLVMTPPEKKP